MKRIAKRGNANGKKHNSRLYGGKSFFRGTKFGKCNTKDFKYIHKFDDK